MLKVQVRFGAGRRPEEMKVLKGRMEKVSALASGAEGVAKNKDVRFFFERRNFLRLPQVHG